PGLSQLVVAVQHVRLSSFPSVRVVRRHSLIRGCHSGRASRACPASEEPESSNPQIFHLTPVCDYWVPALRSPDAVGLAWPGRQPHVMLHRRRYSTLMLLALITRCHFA